MANVQPKLIANKAQLLGKLVQMDSTKTEFSSRNVSRALQENIAQLELAIFVISVTTAKVDQRLKTLDLHQLQSMTGLEVYVQFKTIVTKEQVTQDLAMLALGKPSRASSFARLVKKAIFVKATALKFHVQHLTIALVTSLILSENYALEDFTVTKLRLVSMKSRTALHVQQLPTAKVEDSLDNAQLGIFATKSLILQLQPIWILNDLEKLIPVQLVIGVHKEQRSQFLALLVTLPERLEAGKKLIAVSAQSATSVIKLILRLRTARLVTIARSAHQKPYLVQKGLIILLLTLVVLPTVCHVQLDTLVQKVHSVILGH